jgi:tRNA A37 methylthiotransferase MiaB
MIRIGMMTPNGAIAIKDRLLGLFRNERVYKFLHIPLQSGDDEILKSMGRQYDSRSFIELANFFRENIHDLTLVTDVIVGFPGEDDRSFRRTVEVIKAVKPDKVNISRFTPRPHTIANLMPQIPARIKATRSMEMTKICKMISLMRRREFLGTITKILTLKSMGPVFYGKTHSFIPILLKPLAYTEIGKFYEANISGLSSSGFKGVILRPYMLSRIV